MALYPIQKVLIDLKKVEKVLISETNLLKKKVKFHVTG